LRLPALYGDLGDALARPDTIVIPLSIARKYFGRDNVVGETLLLDRKHPMTVTAVIADIPRNDSNLASGIFLSGVSAYSTMTLLDHREPNGPAGGFIVDSRTLVRLDPGVSVDAVERRMQQMRDVLLPHPANITLAMPYLTPIGHMHMSRNLYPEVAERLEVMTAATFLIWFLASLNFVNLLVARSVRRELEVGVRKAAGAGRRQLMAQFLGESIFQAILALGIALVLVEWLLPVVNALLDTGAALDYGRDSALILLLVLGALLTGLMAGMYPALILSSFRPAMVLRKLSREPVRAGLVREALVTGQFAILIGLVVAAAAAFQQYGFVVRDAVHINDEQVIFVRSHDCDNSFKAAVQALPGVIGVGCSSRGLLQEGNLYNLYVRRDGTTADILAMGVGPGTLELYGLKPAAGRFYSGSRPDDVTPTASSSGTPAHVILNETAVRTLQLGAPEDAVGKIVRMNSGSALVIGVVPDFWIYSGNRTVDPAVYYDDMAFMNPPPGPGYNVLIHIKMASLAALPAVDAAWNRTDATGPIQRSFMAGYIEGLWLPLRREGQAFSVLAGIGVALACLGLFAMSLSAAQRRTKEIGIRKAMGADDGDIVALLLWQFGRPVLWGNLIAWPLSWWIVRRWLAGFPYHIELGLWPFLVAGFGAIVIALLTVSGHALMVARQKPVLALRYE